VRGQGENHLKCHKFVTAEENVSVNKSWLLMEPLAARRALYVLIELSGFSLA
jgi:hypothetical protein